MKRPALLRQDAGDGASHPIAGLLAWLERWHARRTIRWNTNHHRPCVTTKRGRA